MTSRYIANTFPSLLRPRDSPDNYLRSALEDILANCPPLEHYDSSQLGGLWSGPTGLSYLFLKVSAERPRLKVRGHHALSWARSYLKGSRPGVRLSSSKCGIADEALCFPAVHACVARDVSFAKPLLDAVPLILDAGGEYPDELLYGRAGLLYLLRVVRRWGVPADGIDDAIARVSQGIVERGPGWTWHGKRYLGAAHGDIGIVTQLVLGTPEMAGSFESTLEGLIERQCGDGNWPSSEGRENATLVQFCHGAAGFVHALLALREYFPRLRGKIDEAVEKARECIWQQGLLKKEPSLCHGIFGNALALEPGPRREHFLAIATREVMAELKENNQDGTELFAPADYGKRYSLLTSYAPSAVWAWMMCGEDIPGMIGFSDTTV